MKDGIELIAEERQRQITAEDWTHEHDDEHDMGELTWAAACYAVAEEGDPQPAHWPWEATWWKPHNRIRNLARAGALIAAEIDRLQRLGPNTRSDAETSRNG